LVDCRQALTLLRELNHRPGQAATWDSLGYAYHHLGDRGQAVTCFNQAIALYRDLGERYQEAGTLARLGDSHQAGGCLHLA
jgi:cytochrome c-type biogenesis protein CcmH/NrfG